MGLLRFEIRPSPDSNDHEIRIFVDDADWPGPEHLGLDPLDLFPQFKHHGLKHLRIGRCRCGNIGCSDLFVDVTRKSTEIIWYSPTHTAAFNPQQCDSEIERVLNDTSWETLGRRVERRVSNILRGSATADGFTFQWASTRIQPNVVKLSYLKEENDADVPRQQKVLEFNWDGETVESATSRARQFLRELSDN